MPRVLLLMASTTYRAHDFLAAACRLGIDVTVGTDRRQALTDHAPGRNLALDFRDPEAAVEGVRAFARRHPLRAVVGVDDETAILAALASAALGLPSSDPDAVGAAADKFATRERLAAAGLPGPAFRLVSLPADAEAEARRTRYPCVLKPTFLAASRGVIRADDPSSFAAAFRRIEALLRAPDVARRGGERARQILVEAFVPGRELALEGLLVGGALHTLALFDKPDPLDGPFFEETLYVTPSRQPREVQDSLSAAVEAGAAALGLSEGPIHAEVRLRGATPVVLEVAARSIGGLCSRTLRFGTGLSLEDVILAHALGRGAPPAREPAAAGVLMLPIPAAGTLDGVAGLDEARAIPGIQAIEITIAPGQPVVPLPEGDRYLGFAFARADTPDVAEDALRQAHALLEVRIT